MSLKQADSQINHDAERCNIASGTLQQGSDSGSIESNSQGLSQESGLGYSSLQSLDNEPSAAIDKQAGETSEDIHGFSSMKLMHKLSDIVGDELLAGHLNLPQACLAVSSIENEVDRKRDDNAEGGDNVHAKDNDHQSEGSDVQQSGIGNGSAMKLEDRGESNSQGPSQESDISLSNLGNLQSLDSKPEKDIEKRARTSESGSGSDENIEKSPRKKCTSSSGLEQNVEMMGKIESDEFYEQQDSSQKSDSSRGHFSRTPPISRGSSDEDDSNSPSEGGSGNRIVKGTPTNHNPNEQSCTLHKESYC